MSDTIIYGNGGDIGIGDVITSGYVLGKSLGVAPSGLSIFLGFTPHEIKAIDKMAGIMNIVINRVLFFLIISKTLNHIFIT